MSITLFTNYAYLRGRNFLENSEYPEKWAGRKNPPAEVFEFELPRNPIRGIFRTTEDWSKIAPHNPAAAEVTAVIGCQCPDYPDRSAFNRAITTKAIARLFEEAHKIGFTRSFEVSADRKKLIARLSRQPPQALNAQ